MGELERDEPELVGELTLRAARWCQRHGLAEAAIGYAMDAGDADLVARGVEQAAIGVYRSGRLATVQRWFDWFDDHGLIQQYPAVAMLGAWVQALGGHAAAAERWAAAAERGSYEGLLPDGSASIDGWRALLRAKLCRHGVTQMRADAELALTLIAVGSLWRAPAQLLLGISHLLAGDLGVADDVLAEAVEVAQDTGATLAASVALAERAILAIGRQDWRDAETLVEQARSVVATAHLEDCATSVVLYAAAARVAIHQGDRDQAEQDLARAQQLRPQATHALPYYAVQARLELIRAYLALTDVAGARTVLREVDDLLRWRPDLGTLRDQADQLRSQLDHLRGDAIGTSPLTTAELRLLPLLATHHSFREIGQQPAPLPAHGEDPGPVDLPQARRLLARPGGPAGAGDRPARQITTCQPRTTVRSGEGRSSMSASSTVRTPPKAPAPSRGRRTSRRGSPTPSPAATSTPVTLRLHAVIGGDGPPLLLIHGWPQTWYAWRMVMPALARDFQVDRGRPARHRAVRQARRRLRHRHPRRRPGRADGGARPRSGSPCTGPTPACRSPTPWPPTTRTGSTAWSSPRPPCRA